MVIKRLQDLPHGEVKGCYTHPVFPLLKRAKES